MNPEPDVDWSKAEPTFKMTQAEGDGTFVRVEGCMPLSLVVEMMALVAKYNENRPASKSKRKTSGRRKRSAQKL